MQLNIQSECQGFEEFRDELDTMVRCNVQEV